MLLKIYDCEVFKYDWIIVTYSPKTKEWEVIHNDPERVKTVFREEVEFVGFNTKHYDTYIVKAIAGGLDNEQIKTLSDEIINGGSGWSCLNAFRAERFNFFNADLADDSQQGLSLKAIEAHLGMDIRETTVPFDLDRPLNDRELSEVVFYCKHDVEATTQLLGLRKQYLETKLFLGAEKGLSDTLTLSLTNAKLTAMYLDADSPDTPYTDERDYVYPKNLLREYIPEKVFAFYDRLHDKDITDEELFSSKLNIKVGQCPVVISFGGIHGALEKYREDITSTRLILNLDVGSYYPHLMTKLGYCSRNMRDPNKFAEVLETRMAAKKAGNKKLANALKLVVNTTYGAMLNQYNALYDPKNGRSVCISGQLFLLELASHIVAKCSSVRIIQLNTDGIMFSIDKIEISKCGKIAEEWTARTGFTLERDDIKCIVQKDVNNYIEFPINGDKPKIKGGLLVRGVSPAGAFNINNNMPIVSQAIIEYFASGRPPEDTIGKCNDIMQFQIIAKASSKYSDVCHEIAGKLFPAQRCNRVYASVNDSYGTLYKTHKTTGADAKIAGLPEHCVIDNNNELTIDAVNKQWYIDLAKRYISDFQPSKTAEVEDLMQSMLDML